MDLRRPVLNSPQNRMFAVADGEHLQRRELFGKSYLLGHNVSMREANKVWWNHHECTAPFYNFFFVFKFSFISQTTSLFYFVFNKLYGKMSL